MSYLNSPCSSQFTTPKPKSTQKSQSAILSAATEIVALILAVAALQVVVSSYDAVFPLWARTTVAYGCSQVQQLFEWSWSRWITYVWSPGSAAWSESRLAEIFAVPVEIVGFWFRQVAAVARLLSSLNYGIIALYPPYSTGLVFYIELRVSNSILNWWDRFWSSPKTPTKKKRFNRFSGAPVRQKITSETGSGRVSDTSGLPIDLGDSRSKTAARNFSVPVFPTLPNSDELDTERFFKDVLGHIRSQPFDFLVIMKGLSRNNRGHRFLLYLSRVHKESPIEDITKFKLVVLTYRRTQPERMAKFDAAETMAVALTDQLTYYPSKLVLIELLKFLKNSAPLSAIPATEFFPTEAAASCWPKELNHCPSPQPDEDLQEYAARVLQTIYASRDKPRRWYAPSRKENTSDDQSYHQSHVHPKPPPAQFEKTPSRHAQTIIELYPIPYDRRSLRGFLGHTSNISQFIPGYADITAPLTDLLKRNVWFEWSPECQDAVDTLKDQVAHLKLYTLDVDRDLKITIETSKAAVSAALWQFVKDTWLPVEFGLLKLSPTQQNWSATDKELYAVVFAVRKFHVYIAGSSKSIIVETDHRPLIEVIYQSSLEPKHERWLEKLRPYRLHFSHIAKISDQSADALSRYPFQEMQAPRNLLTAG